MKVQKILASQIFFLAGQKNFSSSRWHRHKIISKILLAFKRIFFVNPSMNFINPTLQVKKVSTTQDWPHQKFMLIILKIYIRHSTYVQLKNDGPTYPQMFKAK